MTYRRRIRNLPLSAIMADGVEFRQDKKYNNYSFRIDGRAVFTYPDDVTFHVWMKNSYYDNLHMSLIYKILRNYMNLSREQLIDSDFNPPEEWGIRNNSVVHCMIQILNACDRRIGVDRLTHLLLTTDIRAVREIISYRLSKRGKKK